MNNLKIRHNFSHFFKNKAHQIVPSAPLLNEEDPHLLFVNAGMNPFKDYLLGHRAPPSPRLANSQKCLRVSGKHNDLEEVGQDTYHHTFFEMLGNWSFGDYFKEEAIAWAWEFLVEEIGLEKDRFYVTVFEGNKPDQLAADQESAKLWKEFLPKERILFFGKKDNFWEMGNQGLCGPCTEIHIDLRSKAEQKTTAATQLINTGHPEVIELWNLVFMQYERLANQTLRPLPKQHVDTGMGLERLCMVVQSKASTYDTDLFRPLISSIEEQTKKKYGTDSQQDISFRVIADHIRAVSFTVADGVLPGPVQAGYVMRRLLRRALRYGHTFLGYRAPFLHTLVPILVKQYEEVYPELKAEEAHLLKIIHEEERIFLRTLEKGLHRFSVLTSSLSSGAVIGGEEAFELYDTYGFPIDLTRLMAKEQGFSVNEHNYEAALSQQRKRSQAGAEQNSEDWVDLAGEQSTQSEFIGYEQLETQTKILRYRKVSQKGGTFYELVLARTPFYPEGGGQVGDTGYIYVEEETIRVKDTQKLHTMIVHRVDRLPRCPEKAVRAVVDSEQRKKTECNHTATHLLHAALRQVLGTHVAQRGSQVKAEGLRFDFSHYERISSEQLEEIESIMNDKIRNNLPLEEEKNVPLEEAKARGARALFGEKYGDKVRVISFGGSFSVELCAGTHTPSTGRIGICKIRNERTLAAGVRRIEASTAAQALSEIHLQEQKLQEIEALLKYPRDLKKAIQQQIETEKHLKQRLSLYELEALRQQKQILSERIKAHPPFQLLVSRVSVSEASHLRKLCFELSQAYPNLLATLATEIEEKPYVAVFLDKEVTSTYTIKANEICKTLATYIKGQGGGQSFFATAGGKDAQGIEDMLVEAEKRLISFADSRK